MTSEQIQNLCLQVATMGTKLDDGCSEALSLMQTQATWEIAYQLAVANERNAREAERSTPPADRRCPKCGNPFWSHSGHECGGLRA